VETARRDLRLAVSFFLESGPFFEPLLPT